MYLITCVFFCLHDRVEFLLQDEYAEAQEVKKKELEEKIEAQKTPEDLKQEELQKVEEQIAEMEVRKKERKTSYEPNFSCNIYVYALQWNTLNARNFCSTFSVLSLNSSVFKD